MTYIKWQDELEKYLGTLSPNEKEKVFAYFAEMYADKRDAGIPEEEIIEEFGAPYDAAKRILAENGDTAEQPQNVNETFFSDTPPIVDNADNTQGGKHGNFTWALILLFVIFAIPLFVLIIVIASITVSFCIVPIATIAGGFAAIGGAIGGVVSGGGGAVAAAFAGLGLIIVGFGIILIPLFFGLVKLMWKALTAVFNALRRAFSGRNK